MDSFWEKVEHYNTKLIPYALVVLLFVIVFELFVHTENHLVEIFIKSLDYFVVAVFVIDLTFLAIKAKSVKFFFQNYWLDLIAVFPFVMFFNALNTFYRAAVATERIAVSQAVLHETVEVGKEIEVLAKGEGKIAKVSRIAARGIRAVTKSRFFEKLQAKHEHIRKKPEKKQKRNERRTTRKRKVKKSRKK